MKQLSIAFTQLYFVSDLLHTIMIDHRAADCTSEGGILALRVDALNYAEVPLFIIVSQPITACSLLNFP